MENQEFNQKLSPSQNEINDVGDESIVSCHSQDEKRYTQADIDSLQATIDELTQYKPRELSESEMKLKEKAEQLWGKQVTLEIKAHGLEMFKDFIHVEVDDEESLHTQIKKLKEIVGALELSSGYQPTNHKSVDAYSLAKKSKDAKSMISAKFNL